MPDQEITGRGEAITSPLADAIGYGAAKVAARAVGLTSQPVQVAALGIQYSAIDADRRSVHVVGCIGGEAELKELPSARVGRALSTISVQVLATCRPPGALAAIALSATGPVHRTCEGAHLGREDG